MTLSLDERHRGTATSTGLKAALAEALAEAAQSEGTTLIALPAPVAPSEALLARKSEDAVAWAAPDGLEVLGLGVAAAVEGHGSGRFAEVAAAGSSLLKSVRPIGLLGAEAASPRLFGGFAFQPGTPRTSNWQALGEARFVLPELTYVVDQRRARLLVAARAEPLSQKGARDEIVERVAGALAVLDRGFEAGAEPARTTPLRERPEADWNALVETIHSEIERAALEKVVLARRVEVTLTAEPDPADVLYRLRRQASECTRFLIRHAGVTFLGATPEWLARLHRGALETEAVAGSIGALEPGAAENLLGSQKDLAEHALVLREIMKVLGPFARSLEAASAPELITLRHVLHLRTRVRATLAGSPHLLQLIERLHPTPAVGGIPTARALEWISSHEPDERGWYAAPFGWFDASGDGEMAVALRSGLLRGASAELYVGSGIVRGSTPVAELTETRWKLRALLGALGVSE
jgi:menaquinone-specific isochorismate synthase